MDPTAENSRQGKGKRPKKFVDQKDTALQLAATIGDQQEEKTKQKVDKRHRSAQAPTRIETKSRPSSKEKLKEVKAAIKAQKAQAKKEKAKARKQEIKQQSTRSADSGSLLDTASTQPKRKRVAFA